MMNSKIEVLSPEAMDRVHEASMEILAKKGVIFESEKARDLLKKAGCKVEGEIVFFPRALVEASVKQCPSTFKLQAMDDAKSVNCGAQLSVHPAGGEVFVSDLKQGRRAPLLKDFANMQKVYHACENIPIAGYQPMSPSDVPQRYKGMYMTYESFKHCDKPLLAPMELDSIAEKEENLRLYEVAFGKEGFCQDHYVTWHAVCPNSPLYYSEFACEGIEVYAAWNQPVSIVSAPMSGITSPVFLYSTVALQNAEQLAGLVYAQLIKPGVPVILSASLTYGNLKYASWECAAPDTALMLIVATQMYKDYYHLPARAQTGVTSSKAIDYQAGMETMQSFILTALAGVTLTSQSVGTLENLMCTSFEKTVLDDELIGRVQHILKGMETTEETLALDEIYEADFRGDFMTNDSTLDYCHDDWQPTVSDWESYEQWEKNGSPDLIEQASKRVQKILDEAPEMVVDPAVEAEMKKYMKMVEAR